MDRPVMNPMLMDEEPPQKQRRKIMSGAAGWVWHKILHLLTADLRFWRSRMVLDDRMLAWRVVRAVFYQLLWVPLLIILAVAWAVWWGTHTPIEPSQADPLTIGIHFDRISFVSADGTQLSGWLVPVIDAQRVLQEKENILRRRHPAVILIHDMGQTSQQMLPLIRPLHDAGMVVLAINLRGGAAGISPCTFGLKEAEDVTAAIEMLKKRPFVDPRRIGLVAMGSGANAAILAAGSNPTISALVLDHPLTGFQEVLDKVIWPVEWKMAWARPMCHWVFEMMYQVDCDDLDYSGRMQNLAGQSVLLFDRNKPTEFGLSPGGILKIELFLNQRLGQVTVSDTR